MACVTHALSGVRRARPAGERATGQISGDGQSYQRSYRAVLPVKPEQLVKSGPGSTGGVFPGKARPGPAPSMPPIAQRGCAPYKECIH
jgi:hypothetical protein